jgi:NDP-sugar pyrophosphorylase family protein
MTSGTARGARAVPTFLLKGCDEAAPIHEQPPMSNLMLSLATAATLLFAPAIQAQADISRVNGGISVEAGQQAGNLSTVNGGIRVADNAVIRGAETVNGGIRIGDGVQATSLETVNGGIRIGAGARIEKSVASVNGAISIGEGSEVAGAVENVNGGIRMAEGSSAGSLETVSGGIEVGADARVLGALTVKRPRGSWFGGWSRSEIPRVIIGPRAEVTGPLQFEREVALYLHETARVGEISGAKAIRFSGDTP